MLYSYAFRKIITQCAKKNCLGTNSDSEIHSSGTQVFLSLARMQFQIYICTGFPDPLSLALVFWIQFSQLDSAVVRAYYHI